MSQRSVNLTTLFLGRLRPPKRLTSTVLRAHTFISNSQLPFLKKRKEKQKYVARPGIEPRTPDLRVRCPTDCATRPGHQYRRQSSAKRHQYRRQSSAKRHALDLTQDGTLLKYTRNSDGPRTFPWRAPDVTGAAEDVVPSGTNCWVLPSKNLCTDSKMLPRTS